MKEGKKEGRKRVILRRGKIRNVGKNEKKKEVVKDNKKRENEREIMARNCGHIVYRNNKTNDVQ